MEPRYEDDYCTVYCGAMEDVLPTLSVEPALVLTDPPYGTKGVIGGSAGNRVSRGGITMPNGDKPYDPAILVERFPRLVLFGAVAYAHKLPPSRGWIVWDKLHGQKPSPIYGDAELAWTNIPGPIRVIRHRWMGGSTESEKTIRRTHPAQKPVALMRAIIERYTEPGDLVLDPYCGSGASLVAAKQLGRRAIGIELVPEWAESAVERVSLTKPPLNLERSKNGRLAVLD